MRRRLKDERSSVTHKFTIGSEKGYVIVGLYEDGRPGEVFVRMAKEGSTLGCLLDQWAIAVSIGLQTGVSLGTFVDKHSHCRFEPSGPTGNPDIRIAKSPIDYIARWLGMRFKDHLEPPDGYEEVLDDHRPIAVVKWTKEAL